MLRLWISWKTILKEEEEKTYDARMAMAGCSLRHRPRRVQKEGPDQSDI